MRIFLTIFTAAVFFLGTPLPRLREVPSTAERTLSAQQAAPTPPEVTPNPFACPAAAGVPLSKPTGAAASSQVPGKEQEGHDRAASPEFCLELDRPPSALEECVRKILSETGWSLPVGTQAKDAFRAGRRVEPEELQRVAQTEIGGGRIHWEEGTVNAEIRLIPLSETVTQVRIRTRILAKGSTSLRLMRPSPWWLLVSTGALEGDVLAALKTHCGAKP
jgi:hypothetical protein